MNTAALVGASGAVGGLTSWVIQKTLGAQPFLGWPWYAAIPTGVLLGAVAGLLGVYLVANSDTNELKHTLSYALACGLFWQPVIQSGGTFVAHAQTERQVSLLQQAKTDLTSSLQTAPPDQVKLRVGETATLATGALNSAPQVGDQDLKTKLIGESREAVAGLAQAAPKAPSASINGLTKVGITAVETGHLDVAKEVLESLDKIKAQNVGSETAQMAAHSVEQIQQTAAARVADVTAPGK